MKKKYLITALVFILIILLFVSSKFNNLGFSKDVFAWQKEKYCSFDDEMLSFETRCGFNVVTLFEDGDPSNPLWYVRQTDNDIIKDKMISYLDLSMSKRY